jgi:3-phenylpropionate/trans-cinnamate dioxygenase ferredoxin subunit
MKRHYTICQASEIKAGEHRIVEIEGRSIGIFNVNGRFYALRNRCPHKGAPLCEGVVTGLIVGPEPYCYAVERHGEILRCPWHGWEFDITNGQSIFNPHRVRVRNYEISVGELEPSLETFSVEVEKEFIILHME